MLFFENKTNAAQYVSELQGLLKPGYVLITITRAVKSGGYSVTSATVESSDATEVLNSFGQLTSIY